MIKSKLNISGISSFEDFKYVKKKLKSIRKLVEAKMGFSLLNLGNRVSVPINSILSNFRNPQ